MKVTIFTKNKVILEQIIFLIEKYEKFKNVSFTVDTNSEFSDINCPDIVFFYIYEASKIELIRKFCLNHPNSKTIIIANIPDYRYVFQFHAFDFITLPISEEKFFHAIDDALYYITNSCNEKQIALQTTSIILNIKPSQIYYFEHNSRKVIISTEDGEYLCNYALKELYKKFHPYYFDSPHKSYLINLAHIRYIKGFDIYLTSGVILPLAQKKAVYFKSVFQHYLKNRFEIL